MTKVITYGTYDLLHYGHIKLLERAKALGDYLIVGVTADDFDKTRGKINVQQTLMERIEAVRATGIADEIIVEEYEGQKIDDIKRYGVDIFTVGSDWVGKFDYLNEYCKVVYLERTKGVSSSELRSKEADLRIGLVGDTIVVNKFVNECKFVNGVSVSGIYTVNPNLSANDIEDVDFITDLDLLIDSSDALYIASHPTKHYVQIKKALEAGKHVIYESPLTLSVEESRELFELAEKKSCILYAGIKTAYATAYARMILLIKSGKIGDVVSIDATCTSIRDINFDNSEEVSRTWNSICSWGPTAMLPIFQLLGTEYKNRNIVSKIQPNTDNFDIFTKIDWIYPEAVASIKVGKGVKSEGELIISGTKGYIYVPAPWWKTDYFEIRYEDQSLNRRFFYQLDGEGIRNMIVSFVKSIRQNKIAYIKQSISEAISETVGAASKSSVKI